MICSDIPAPIYLLFSEAAPQLLYYTHIPTMLVAISLGVFVFVKNKSIQGFSLLMLTISFSIWVLLNLIQWTAVSSDLILLTWSIHGFVQPLIFVFAAYFVLSFIQKNNVRFSSTLAFILGAIPLILLHQKNVSGFDLNLCEATENSWFNVYFYGFQVAVSLWISWFCLNNYRKNTGEDKRKIGFLSVGMISFLAIFFSAEFLSTYLSNAGHTNAYEIAMYGLFGMTFFLIVLGYLIVKFKAFNIELLAAQALVTGLIILISAELFFVDTTINFVLIYITLVLASVGGYFLVRSVKREVALRERIEELAITLEKANDRLKILDKMKSEFVSIASHQLRSPLTSIRGYSSMLLEGSYGKLPTKAKEAIERIGDSSRYMALSVEDYLNVSRIEAGNMKYEKADFNLKEVTEKVVDEMRPAALKKGLVLVFRSDCNGSCSVNADIGKTRQVILNLVDNAMKYTPKGSITVVAHDDVKKKKMYVSIQDTGIGMSPETIHDVFDKFVRAKNANQVNVTGTGLGLFVAKKMAEEMGGRVWAESEGEGKGSIFHFELPLLPGKYLG